MKEKKRNFLILSSLGVLALLLLIFSFALNNEGAAEPDSDVTDETIVEESLEEEISSEVVEEEPATEDVDSDEVGMTLQEVGEKRAQEDIDARTRQITDEKYVSEIYPISFKVPSSWIGKVSVIEKNDRVAFVYKGEHVFLNFYFVSKGEYAHDSSYYDAMLRKIMEFDLNILFYAPVGEHPLYDEEGSDDYNEILQFVDDAETMVETVEALN